MVLSALNVFLNLYKLILKANDIQSLVDMIHI